ncbi:hypothetical protein [Nocardiopsis rhodophaea]|uniref:hypothetical protein n=1 Tax=Nocardiopsis rhodophaea TaxID=280238 RepID=UPI0031D99EE5
MTSLFSDDALSTYSSITVPAGTTVNCRSEGAGEMIALSFGVHERVTLDIDPSMVGPIVDGLTQARAQAEAAASAAAPLNPLVDPE